MRHNYFSILSVFCLLLISLNSFAQTNCFPPENLKANKVGSTYAKITWSKVNSSFGYKLRARIVGSNEWIAMKVIATDTSVKISSLAPNSNYEMQILSFCDINFTDTSSYSSKINFHTEFPCEAPKLLKVDSVTAVSAILHWTGSLNSSKFVIRYRTQGEKAKWESINVSEGYINSFKLTNLHSGAKYMWTVSCKCDGNGLDVSPNADPPGSFTTHIH